MRLIGYVRVSKEERLEARRAHRHSVALVQPRAIEAWCAQAGHELVDLVVDDGVSAAVPFEARPGGAQVFAQLAAGKADGLVVWMLDRAFRMGVDALSTGTRMMKRGWALNCVCEPVDITSRHGWLAFGILALTAEFERGKIVDRAVAVTSSLRDDGRVYGPVPFGCVRVGDRLFRDPATWPVRQHIVRLKAAGATYKAIGQEMRLWRYPAPGGGRLWHKSTLRKIVLTHDDLEAIPPLPDAPEAEVSA